MKIDKIRKIRYNICIRNEKGLTAMKNSIDNSTRRLIREEMYHDDFAEYYDEDQYNRNHKSSAPIGSYAWLMNY